VQYFYHQAKASVKNAAMPVIKASEFQLNKAKFQRKIVDKPVEEEAEEF